MIFQVTELMNSQARTQTHSSGLFITITQSWSCPAHTTCPKGLMYAWSVAEGPLELCPGCGPRGASLLPCPWELGSQRMLQEGGASGELLSTSKSAALQEASSTDQETLRRTGISAGFCLCSDRNIPRGLAEATSALETRLLPF